MLSAVNSWELASSAGKLLGLLAMAGVTGGAFSLGLARRQHLPQDRAILRYILLSAALGFIAACLFFLIQVGTISQNGIPGMFDGLMISILGQSDLGLSLGLRLLGFGGVAVAVLWLHGRLRSIVLVGAIVVLAFAFSVTGHISTLSYVARAGIVLHVLAAFMWVGSLYPLLRLSASNGIFDAKRLMQLFGELAVYVVGVLLLSGVFLLTRTLGSFEALFTTSYGLAVLAKLSGVFILLCLAAANKLVLVPGLITEQSVRKLRWSIRTEMLIALFILAVTAVLTTVIGPAH